MKYRVPSGPELKVLREKRMERTVKEAAAALEVTRAAWYHWEAGKRKMPKLAWVAAMNLMELETAQRGLNLAQQHLKDAVAQLQTARARIKELETRLAGHRDLT